MKLAIEKEEKRGTEGTGWRRRKFWKIVTLALPFEETKQVPRGHRPA
jgi:hypothetical protein